MRTDDGKLRFFGVGLDGQRAFEPIALDDVAEVFEPRRRHHADELVAQEARKQQLTNHERALGPTGDVTDPDDLGQTGWAVVWTDGVTPEIKQALAPLIAHRAAQIEATRRARDHGAVLLRELEAHRSDTLDRLRKRWGFSTSPIKPTTLPSYLMIVGPPSDLSFELQRDLDVDFFVGRLDLADAVAYSAYARSVIASERAPQRPRRAVFFGPRHGGAGDDSDATALSLPNLVAPLAQRIEALGAVGVERAFAAQATKAALTAVLCDEVPALLFTAGHGAVGGNDSDERRALWGALISQDWTAEPGGSALHADHRFAAADLAGAALDGLIAVLFACYGGGVPARSRFPYYCHEGIRQLASADFTAALPRAMLARGAGAVIAHVERTWDTGFSWEGVGESQIELWASLLEVLLAGARVGRAAAFLDDKYASISSELSTRLRDEQDLGVAFPRQRRAYLWMQHADMRGWIVLGDPAARLSFAR